MDVMGVLSRRKRYICKCIYIPSKGLNYLHVVVNSFLYIIKNSNA